MENFRIQTDNAIESYLRDPSLPRAQAIVATFQDWPFWSAAQHAGIVLAVFDVMRDKYEVRTKWRWSIAQWVTRKGCPEWKPTWGDYWLLYWKLTKDDRPGLAYRALRELHRRGWHLPFALDTPQWGYAEACALRLIRQESSRNPEFQAAIAAEIKASPCIAHDVVAH